MPKLIDITGQTFGELTVIEISDKRYKNNSRLWKCVCSCGRIVYLLGIWLRYGHYKSCGCLRVKKRDAGVKKHIEKDAVDGTRISALNVKMHVDNKSGHKGVMWMKHRSKWKAYIGYKGKQIHLGHFDTIEEAIDARKKAEEYYFKPILEDKNE